jgi:signal transduction histidine kinase
MRSAAVFRPGRFGYSRPQSAGERLHVERVLAIARIAMCLACLVAAWSGALTPRGAPSLVRMLLLGYAAQSLLVFAVVRAGRVGPSIAVPLHVADFGWAVALTVSSGGAASPFFVLFLFVLLSAAFRWKLFETVLTGGAAVLAIAAQAWGLSGASSDAVIRGTYIGVAAVLVGLLAEDEKVRRAQLGVIGELLAGVQSKTGFRVALRFLATALLRLTGSTTLLIAAREIDSTRAILWGATPARTGKLLLTSTEIPEDRHGMYFFHGRGDGWSIVRRRRDTCSVTAIDGDGDVMPGAECGLEGRFWQFHQHHAAIAIAVGFGGAWRGRVFLLRDRRYSLGELRFVHRALCQLVPAMHNQYLARRLRVRASAAERRRVARGLNDGVIRSLVGLERRTAALRRELGPRDPRVDEQLQQMERVLGDEANAVRDVMHQIRPFEAGPGQFVPALAEMVERFGRETGLTTNFYAAPNDAYVPPHAARDLARTLHEALMNVRRHSGARRVTVDFRTDVDAWRLDVENDGRPFGFLGRLDLEELEARRLGPRVIKERVREMGGGLVIASSATAGVRLEISLPRPEGQSKSA